MKVDAVVSVPSPGPTPNRSDPRAHVLFVESEDDMHSDDDDDIDPWHLPGAPCNSDADAPRSHPVTSAGASGGADVDAPSHPGARDAPEAIAERAPRRAGGLGGDWVRLDVQGGYLLWSQSKNSLDAHCTSCDSQCKTDRTLKAGSGSSGQGRPLGRQLLWLRLGCDRSAVPSRVDHGALRKSMGTDTWHAERSAIRTEFTTQFGADDVAQAILAAERPRRDGEPPEPVSVP
jgi:hypothetical protein